MIKDIPRFLVAALVLFSVAVAASSRGEMIAFTPDKPVGFPQDKPAFTFSPPADSKVEYMAGLPAMDVSGKDDKMFLTFSTLPAGTAISDAASAKAAFTLVAATLGSEKPPVVTEPTESTVAGNKAYTVKITITMMGSLTTSDFTVFTPDGSTYYRIYSKGDCSAIIASIKPAA